MRYKRIGFTIGAALLACMLIVVPTAAPDVWNQRTEVRFSEPIELPGGVVIPPGEYVMKRANTPSNRHIVHVWNADQDRLYATVLTIPAQRSSPSDKTVITFRETQAGAPRVLDKWYYPGDTIGHEFPRPRAGSSYMARAAPVSGLPAQTNRQSVSALQAAPEPVEAEASQPGLDEIRPAETELAAEPLRAPDAAPSLVAKVEQTPQLQPLPADSQVSQSIPGQLPQPAPATDERLPSTASSVSEVALAGAAFVLVALGLAITRRVALRTGREPEEGC